MKDRCLRSVTIRSVPVLLAAVVLGVSGCSNTSEEGAAATTEPTTESTTSSTTTATFEPPSCEQGATTEEVVTAPVEGVASDLTLTSFDGTEIRLHWFPADGVSASAPAPTVLMGPGWSLAGSMEGVETVAFGALDITAMNERGYNVLTWDPRGFGKSGGTASVNDPALEGRDAQVLLDWVAEQPEALTDDEGDPRVGMVGFSYGGGIQLTLAGLDCRVDAIVPGIAWNSLETSLLRGDTVKTGWAGVLVDAAVSGRVDPHVASAYQSGTSTGTLSEADREWFTARGPAELVEQIRVPTLLVQGTVDTLFTPDEAITNYGILADNDVPVGMLWFCGGHGACLTEEGDPTRIKDATLAWLDRWVKGDEAVDTGPALDLLDQDGVAWTGDEWPPKPGDPLTAKGAGTLPLVAEGGASGIELKPGQADVIGGLVKDITPSHADNSVDVVVEADADTLVLGAPELTLTYTGTAAEGDRPTRLFAQLVDNERGVVVGNQITPIPVTLDGQEHTVTVPLESVIHHLGGGEALTLQVVATTTAYAEPRLGGEVELSAIEVSLPTTSALEAA
jgi:ABC-2 type transport system ATP-binding protein